MRNRLLTAAFFSPFQLELLPPPRQLYDFWDMGCSLAGLMLLANGTYSIFGSCFKSLSDSKAFRKNPTRDALVNASNSPAPLPPAVDAAAILAPQDCLLLQACLASTPGAWDEFVARFAGLMFHVVDRTSQQRQVSLSPDDRYTIVAETILELLRNDAHSVRSFALRSSLPTYLTVIARRVAVRWMVRTVESSYPVRPPEGSLAQTEKLRYGNDPNDVDARALIADDAEGRECQKLIEQGLTSSQATLLWMYQNQRKSYGEISRATGMPLGEIGPAISLARKKIVAS